MVLSLHAIFSYILCRLYYTGTATQHKMCKYNIKLFTCLRVNTLWEKILVNWIKQTNCFLSHIRLRNIRFRSRPCPSFLLPSPHRCLLSSLQFSSSLFFPSILPFHKFLDLPLSPLWRPPITISFINCNCFHFLRGQTRKALLISSSRSNNLLQYFSSSALTSQVNSCILFVCTMYCYISGIIWWS